MGKFHELMRVGTFKDRHGVSYDITKDVLNKIAETFTPSKAPALLVGHPDSATAPSFGVVDALKVVGDKLLFRPAKAVAEFVSLVNKGGFPSVSAGLTSDLSTLNHVAFLSAQKPAIDGLAPIAEFSAQPEGETVSIDVTETASPWLAEFASTPDWWTSSRFKDIGGALRGMKNNMIETVGAEKADAVIPEYVITRLMEDPPVEEAGGDFSAPPAKRYVPGEEANDTIDYEAEYNNMLPQFQNAVKTVGTIDETNKRLLADNRSLKVKLDAAEKHIRRVEFEQWVEGRITEGRVLPDEKVLIVDRMEAIFQGNGAEFSADPEKDPYPIDIYKRQIMDRPKRKLMEPMPPAQFSSGGVELDAWEVGKRAQRYQDEMKAKGTTVNVFDALAHVRQSLGQA